MRHRIKYKSTLYFLFFISSVFAKPHNKAKNRSVGFVSPKHYNPYKELCRKIINSEILDIEEIPKQYHVIHYLYSIINNKQHSDYLLPLLKYPLYIVSFRKAVEDSIVMMRDGEIKRLCMNALLENYIKYDTNAATVNFKYLVVMNYLRKKTQVLHYQKYKLSMRYFEEIVYNTVQVPSYMLEQLYKLYQFDLYRRFLFLIKKHNLKKAEETANIICRNYNDQQIMHIINRLKFLSTTKYVPKVFCTLEELHWFVQENYTKMEFKLLADMIITHHWLLKQYNSKDYSILKKNIVSIFYKIFPTLIIMHYDKIEEFLFNDWIAFNEDAVHILSYLRGIYCFYKGDYHQALRYFQQALGKHESIKDRAKYLFWIANSYLALGDRNKAYTTYQEVSKLYIPYYSTMSNYMTKKPLFIQSVYNLTVDIEEHPNDWYFHTLELFASADESIHHYIGFVHNINGNLLLQVTQATIEVLKQMTTLANHGYITILGNKIRDKTGLILKESYMMPLYLDKYPVKHRFILYSLLRKESYGRYTHQLSSGKNAKGIMQIMEVTAKTLCQRYNIPYSVQRLVNDHDYNIQIGSKCVEELLRIFKQSVILAITAYNAGSPQVLKWKKAIYSVLEQNTLSNKNSALENGLLNYFVFIELIPVTETKWYVKEVLDSLVIMMNIHDFFIGIT